MDILDYQDIENDLISYKEDIKQMLVDQQCDFDRLVHILASQDGREIDYY